MQNKKLPLFKGVQPVRQSVSAMNARFFICAVIIMAQVISTAFGFGSVSVRGLFGVSPAHAAQGIASSINYQGKLMDAGGNNVVDGAYNIKFTIYDSAVAGSQLWSASTTNGLPAGTPASVSVTVENGLFSILLGDESAGQVSFPADLFNNDELYLGVTVGADAEMTPRKRLSAVPYAHNAKTLQGQYASSTIAATGGELFALNQASTDSAIATRTALYVETKGTSNSNDYLIRANNSVADVFNINREGNIWSNGTLQIQGASALNNTLSVSATSSFADISLSGRVNSSLLPYITDTYSLGNSAYRWLNLAAANVSSTNIDSSGYVSTTNLYASQSILGNATSTNLYNSGIVSTTALYVNGQLITPSGSTSSLQDVTDQGNATTNWIQFAGATSTNNFLPGTDNLFSLGSSAYRWSNLFAINASLVNVSSTNMDALGYVSTTNLYASTSLLGNATSTNLYNSGTVSTTNLYVNGTQITGTESQSLQDVTDVGADTNNRIQFAGATSTSDIRLIGNLDNTFANGQNIAISTTTILNAQITDLITAGDYLYVSTAEGASGLYIFDISDKDNIFQLSTTTLPFMTNAHRLQLSGDMIFVVDPNNYYLNIVDVGDVRSPVLVTSTYMGDGASDVEVSGNFAFVSTDGGLKVYDISDIKNPVLATTTGSLFFSIDLQSEFIYTYNSLTDLMYIVDVTTPDSPEITSNLALGAGFDPTDIYVKGSYAYVLGVGGYSNPNLKVVDISDAANPIVINTTSLSTAAERLHGSGRYLYLTNQQVFDIKDPANPIKVFNNNVFTSNSGIYSAGRYTYSVYNPWPSGDLVIMEMGGIETNAMEAHNALLGSLQVLGDVKLMHQLTVTGGINIGSGNFFSHGAMAITATSTLSDLTLTGRVNSNLLPYITDTYSLGNSTYRWLNLAAANVSSTNIDTSGYVSTTNLYVNGTQITGTESQTLQDVTDIGATTTNWIQFAGATSTNNFLPGTDNLFSLGSSAYRWSNLFAINASLLNVSSTNMDALGYVSTTNLYASTSFLGNATSTNLYNSGTVSTTNLYVNGTQIIGGNPNFQQVTDQGSVTTNWIQFAGATTTANFVPTSTNLLSLGTSANRWSDLWSAAVHIGTSTWDLTQESNGRLAISNSSNERVSVTTDGNVGIGLTAPTEALDVYGSIQNILYTDQTFPLVTSTSFLSGAITGGTVVGNYAYFSMTGGGYGLASADISNPEAPILVASSTGGVVYNPLVIGGYLYLPAGNIIIYDISDPSVLENVGNYSTDLDWVRDVAQYGKYLLVPNPNNSKLLFLDLSDPENLTLASDITLGSGPTAIDVQGTYAYVLNQWGRSFSLVDIENPLSPSVASTTGFAANFEPFDIAVSGKYAYVVGSVDFGTYGDMYVFDISDPASPQIATSSRILTSGEGGLSSINITGRYAYLNDGGDGAITIVDINDPKNPVRIARIGNGYLGSVNNGKYLYTSKGGKIAVYDIRGTETNGLLAHSAELGSLDVKQRATFASRLSADGGLSVGSAGLFSLGNLGVAATSSLADLTLTGRLNSNLLPYITDTYSLGNSTYRWLNLAAANVSSTNIDALGYVSTTNLYASESILGNATSTNLYNSGTVSTTALYVNGTQITGATLTLQQVTNAGYLTNNAIGFAGASSTGHFLPTVNTTYDLGSPSFRWRNLYASNGIFTNVSSTNIDALGYVSTTNLYASTSLLGNATSTNLYNSGTVSTTNLYVNGTQITGTGSTPNFQQVTDIGATTTNRIQFAGATSTNDIRLIGNMDNTLQADQSFESSSSTITSGSIADMYIVGDHLFITVAEAAGTMQIFNIADKNNIFRISTTTLPFGSNYNRLLVDGGYAYTVNPNNQYVSIVDISDLGSPFVVTTTSMGTLSASANDIAVSSGYLYVQTYEGLKVVNIGDINNPYIATSTNQEGQILYKQGRFLYSIDNNSSGNDYFHVIDTQNPESPQTVGTITMNVSYDPTDIFIKGDYAYITAVGGYSTPRLLVVDISDATNPNLVQTVALSSVAERLHGSGRYIYLTNQQIYDIYDPANPVKILNNNFFSQAVFSSGRYVYFGDNPWPGGDLVIMDIGGIETNGLVAHNAEMGSVQVIGDARVMNQLNVNNGISAGLGGIYTSGGLVSASTSTLSDLTLTGRVNSNLLPYLTDTYSLGNSTYHWLNLAVANVSSTNIDALGYVSTTDLYINGTQFDPDNYFAQNGNSFGSAAILGTNDSNTLGFETNNTVRWEITASGKLMPELDATYDLGQPLNRIYSIYVVNGFFSNVSSTNIDALGYVSTTNLYASTSLLGNATSTNLYNSGTVSTTALYVNGTQITGAGGSQSLQQVTDQGYVTTNPIRMAGATSTDQLFVLGSQDAPQLVLQANSTQSLSNPLIQFRNSAGTAIGGITTNAATNIFAGLSSGESITSGNNNSFFGSESGMFVTTGEENTAVGSQALNGNWDDISGSYNTAIGAESMYGLSGTNITGNYNSALGYQSLLNVNSGRDNTAIGAYTLRSLTSGYENTALGSTALEGTTTGIKNIGIGFQAAWSNSTGTANIAIGNEALYNNNGDDNVAIGKNSSYIGTSVSETVAVGYEALYTNNVNGNVGIGFNAVRANGSGARLSGMGRSVMVNNTSGSDNTAIGYESSYYNETGSYNTSLGSNAMHGTWSNNHSHNTGIGYNSLYAVSTGSNNTALGSGSLTSLTTGASNTAVGLNAGANLTSGINNIIIGSNVSAPSATGNNQLNIGNALYGNLANGYIGIGDNSPAALFTVGSGDLFQVNSSGYAYHPAGTNANPSISFVGDPNTGIYNFLADTLGFSAGGSLAGALEYGAMYVYGNDTLGGGLYLSDSNRSNGMYLRANNNISSNFTLTLPGAVPGSTAFLKSDSSGNLSWDTNTYASLSSAFVQNGNSFGTDGVLGTNDTNALFFETNNTGRGSFDISGTFNLFGSANSTRIAIRENASQTNDNPLIALQTFGGSELARFHTDDTSNLFAGFESGINNTVSGLTGVDNSFYGNRAGAGNTTGRRNVAIGSTAMYGNGSTYASNQNTAVGHFSQYYIQTGATDNASVGAYSLTQLTTGDYNAALGSYALNSTTIGQNNVAVGYAALTSAVSTEFNVALGSQSLYSATGNYNTAGGYQSLYSATSSNYNTAFGYQAGRDVRGTLNVAIGAEAMGNAISYGGYNTAVGYGAMDSYNGSGGQNTAIGYGSMPNLTSGTVNSGLGENVFPSLTTGDYNTAVGNNAGANITTGNNNTYLGYNARASTNITNSMALGYNAIVDTTNKVVIGNSSVTAIGGYAAWSNYSDIRVKENIEDYNVGLEFILDLNPRRYEMIDWDDRKVEGFIAQEVKQVMDAHGISFSGYVDPALDGGDPDSLKSLSYAQFVVPLVNSVQELYASSSPLWNGITIDQNFASTSGPFMQVDQDGNIAYKGASITSQGTASASTQSFDSYTFSFMGSAWNSESAQEITTSFDVYNNTIHATSSELKFIYSTGTGFAQDLLTITNSGDVHVSGDLHVGRRLYLGSKTTGESSTSTYIFVDDTLGASSTYIATNADGWQTETTYDYAERYESTEVLMPGDLVTVDPSGINLVKRSASPNDVLLGIVSTKPGFVTGRHYEGWYPVALAGRVPTRVSTKNGAIKAGDYITASDMPGVGVKSADTANVIGIALEPYDLPGEGLISVFVKSIGSNVGAEGKIVYGPEKPEVASTASGFAMIKAGSKEVTVNFSSVGGYPLVKITPYGSITGNYWLTNVSDTGFTAVLSEMQTHDLMISYEAVLPGTTEVMLSDGTTAQMDDLTGTVIYSQGTQEPDSEEPVATATSTQITTETEIDMATSTDMEISLDSSTSTPNI